MRKQGKRGQTTSTVGNFFLKTVFSTEKVHDWNVVDGDEEGVGNVGDVEEGKKGGVACLHIQLVQLVASLCQLRLLGFTKHNTD